jgi:hypothetical protein
LVDLKVKNVTSKMSIMPFGTSFGVAKEFEIQVDLLPLNLMEKET